MMMRIVLMMVLMLGLTTTGWATHVCPSLNDYAPVVPQVGSDGAKARHATELIRRKIAEGKNLPPGQLKKLVTGDLKDRAPDLRWFCRENPDACFSALLPIDERALIGADGCLEQNVTFEGTLGTIVARTDTGSTTQTVLQTRDGRQVRISAALPQQERLRGKRKVRLTGTALGASDLFVGQSDSVIALDVTGTSTGFENPPAWVRGPVRVLLVAVAFADSPVAETVAQLQADAAVIQAYYNETSHGQSQMVVTAFPRIVTLTSTTACSPGADHNAVVAAIDAEVDFRTVDVFGLFSNYSTCVWGGVAYLGNPVSLVGTTDGDLHPGMFLSRESRPDVAIHEIGHSFDLHHGAGFAVPAWFPPGNAHATGTMWGEYDYALNALGLSKNRGPFGALHRYVLNWLAPPDVLLNPPVGTYTLVPVGSPLGSGPQGLLMRRAVSDYLVLELRRPINAWESFVGPTQQPKRFGCGLLSSYHSSWPHEGMHKLAPRTYQGCDVGDVIDDVTGTRVRIVAVTATTMTVAVEAVGAPDLTPPATQLTTPVWDAVVTGPLAMVATLVDVAPYGVRFRLYCGNGQNTYTAVDTTPPYEGTLDTAACPDGVAYAYATGYDAVGQGHSSVVRIQTHNGTGPISTTTVVTTTSTTTTTDPFALVAVVDSDTPDPSPWNTPVRICAHGSRAGVGVLLDRFYVSGGTACQAAASPPASQLCCDATLTLSHNISVFVYAGGVWSGATLEPHTITTGTTTTTVSPTTSIPTTTSSSSSTTTLRPTTTSSTSSTSTLAPTTSSTSTLKPTTTSTSTTTSRPPTTVLPVTTTTTSTRAPTTSTTLAPCLVQGTRCYLNGIRCCSPTTCRRKGGQRRCRL